MPRRNRCVLPSVLCHITQRGVDHREVFSSDQGRNTHLRLVRENLKRLQSLFWGLGPWSGCASDLSFDENRGKPGTDGTFSDILNFPWLDWHGVVAVGVPHHITQRGNGRQFILTSDAERTVYMDLLRQAAEFHSLSVLGYKVAARLANQSTMDRKPSRSNVRPENHGKRPVCPRFSEDCLFVRAMLERVHSFFNGYIPYDPFFRNSNAAAYYVGWPYHNMTTNVVAPGWKYPLGWGVFLPNSRYPDYSVKH